MPAGGGISHLPLFAQQRAGSNRGVVAAGGIAFQRKKPTAVLFTPVVRSTVRLALPPCCLRNSPRPAAGLTACAFGTSAKQTSETVIRTDGMRVFISREFRKTLASLSRLFAASRRSPLRVPETQSAFSSARTMNACPASRCASAIQIVRPLESIAETQPQAESGFARDCRR